MSSNDTTVRSGDDTTVRLAAALDAVADPATGPGGFDPAGYAAAARAAEAAGLDFVTLGDTLAGPGADALAVLARIAPETRRIGLVPTVTTTHTEPFHVSSAVATLDWVSRGRAGWTVDVSRTEAEAALVGRKPAAPEAALWREAAEAADAVARLWDSWEDDAEIRDIATGRFVDRDKLHHIDFEGEHFSVRGPAIVPRPPQGRPPVVVDATEEGPRAVALRHADVALVRAEDPVTARDVREELRSVREDLVVLASLPVELPTHCAALGLADLLADWWAEGAADGFHLRFADPEGDLSRFRGSTLPVLRKRGLRPGTPYGDGDGGSYEDGGPYGDGAVATLRAALGLPRPVSRYAAERSAAVAAGAAGAAGKAGAAGTTRAAGTPGELAAVRAARALGEGVPA